MKYNFYSIFLYFSFHSPFIIAFDVTDKEGDLVTIYEESYALLIGVSEYKDDQWKSLPSIPNELSLVRDVLEEHEFQITTVLDPDLKELKSHIQEFIDKHGYKPENRVLIYYAGHGHTWKSRGKGYLVPADAPYPIGDENPGVSFSRRSLPISQMVEWSSQMEAKHALFVFDSCFSGTVFDVGRSISRKYETPNFILESAVRPVRQFITSGKAGEIVPQVSEFTPEFVNAIRFKHGDLNKDGYISGEELGIYLQQSGFKNQTPQYGKHPDKNLSRGDFIFLSPTVGSKIIKKELDANEYIYIYVDFESDDMSGAFELANYISDQGIDSYIETYGEEVTKHNLSIGPFINQIEVIEFMKKLTSRGYKYYIGSSEEYRLSSGEVAKKYGISNWLSKILKKPEILHYYLQAGAFVDKEDAKAMVSTLRSSGIAGGGAIQKISKDDVEIYRVRLGPFYDIDSIQSAQNSLAESGVGYLVIRVQK